MNVNQFKKGVEDLSGETEVWVWDGKEVPRGVISMLLVTSRSTGQSQIVLFTEEALIADEVITSHIVGRQLKEELNKLLKEEVKES